MELFDTTQIGLEAALRGGAARQQAIAQNIANVNTPGYKRVDVPFADVLGKALGDGDRSALEHMRPTAAVDSTAVERADGSSVDIDRESAAQATNGIWYQSVTTVMRGRIDILESAIGAR